MNIKELLSKPISLYQVAEICQWVHGPKYTSRREYIYKLSHDTCTRVAINALWTLTHLDGETDTKWISSKRQDLIYNIMRENVTAKIRLTLNLLLRIQHDKENINVDFIEFCIQKITDKNQPYAIRAACIKLAYELMRHYPELLQELSNTLDLLSQEYLSPGLVSARRQVTDKIKYRIKIRGI